MIRPRVVVCSPVILAFALVLVSAAAARAQSGNGFFPLDPQGFATGSITLDINESGTVLMRRVDGTYIWTQANGDGERIGRLVRSASDRPAVPWI